MTDYETSSLAAAIGLLVGSLLFMRSLRRHPAVVPDVGAEPPSR